MGLKFNPFSGTFDAAGASDAAPFAGQVNAYADLPLDSTAALNSRWLVKNNSGTWPFSTYKQAGIYIRVNTVGASRDTDYQFVGTLPSVMNDSEFLMYDDADATKNLKFSLSGIATGTTRTINVPDRSGLVTLESQTFDFYYASAPSGATGGSGTWTWNIPSWSTHQLVVMIGAGGGGGSGRVGASGTVCGGGGGGGGGSYCILQARITGGDQIEVFVGAGGAGGAARGPSATNGVSGSLGGVTRIRWVTPNLYLGNGAGLYGTFGQGGSTALGIAGGPSSIVSNSIIGIAGSGGSGVAGSLTANAGNGSATDSTQGGRQGGSISAAPAAFNGGGLGSATTFTTVPPQFLLPTVSPQFGTAGIGGNASLTANGGDGGNAGQIGGGGGGGAAALVGFLSGAGGNGGDGFVRIICF